MTTLVLGATGATGRLLAKELLDLGQAMKVIVRTPDSLPHSLRNHDRVRVIQANISTTRVAELAEHLKGCESIALCLGHNLSFWGIFGPPWRLVTHAVRTACSAIRANSPARPVRLVLMNTAGNSNRDIPERVSFGESCAIGLIRLLLPPHADNECAADYLRTQVGPNDPAIEWCVVRPDTLTNESAATEYEVHPSPTRSAVFDPGRTSRINVGHFMAKLITDDDCWSQWKGRMPVIYNKPATAATPQP